MKQLITFLFCCSFALTLNAQTDTTFFDSEWEICTRTKAEFYRIVEKKDNYFIVKDYFLKTNTPQMIAQCNNSTDKLIKNGKCTYFNDKGQKDSEGTYKLNEKVGIWIDWYEEGKDSSVTEFLQNGDPKYIRIAKKQIVSPDGEVYTIVEKMPAYPGGQEAMVEFIQKNIKYPKKKKTEGTAGTCYVTFIVDKEGALTNIRVLRGVKNGPQFDEAALDVIKKMPKWEPGTQNGKKVKVQYNLPIKFKL